MRVHGRRRGQADRLADLADGRWVAVVVGVADDEVVDLALALGEHVAPSLVEHLFATP